MPIIRSLLFLVLTSQLIFCSHSNIKVRQAGSNDETPIWIDNPYKSYPRDLYFSGVSTGDTRESAENNAMGSIAKIFKSNIKVDQTVVENFYETETTFESQSSLNRRTSVGSDLELKNIKIVDTWFSSGEGLYYARAILDREETAAVYRREIEENDVKISENYENYKNSPKII